jgi:pimeloyl-ACP methyl ester carboxylesterase
MRFHSFHFYRPSFLRFLYNFPLRLLTLFATNRSPASNLTYWYRPHTSKTRLPILFIHGIGVGLYPYINFLADLNTSNGEDRSDGQLGVIAIEIMSISSRITAEAMSKDEMCNEIQVILKAHGWDKVVLITHSRVFSRHYNPFYLSILT